MNKIFVIYIILTCFYFNIYSKNSSYCNLMYLNNITNIDCSTNTSCCYYRYIVDNSTYSKCYKKTNPSDTICSQYQGIIELAGGTLIECTCSSEFLKQVFAILLILVIGI